LTTGFDNNPGPGKGRLPVYRVDIDHDLSLAQRFNVRSIPTVLLVRAGKEIARLDGYITEADLKTAFNQGLDVK